MSSSTSRPPCAACKICYRVCNEKCVFAPYFPPDQSQQFQSLDRVYGDTNGATILNELRPNLREDAVSSLAYEPQARINNLIYGCVGIIYSQQERLNKLESELHTVKLELAAQGPGNSQKSYEVKVGIEQDLLRNLEQYQQQQEQETHFAASPGAMCTTTLTLGGSYTSQITQQQHQQQLQHQQQGMMVNIGSDGQKSTPTGLINLSGDSGAMSTPVALGDSFMSQLQQCLHFMQQSEQLQTGIQQQQQQQNEPDHS
ncbi:hypothetical protein QVD17_03180 [Tagetes erecta]|uniref:LOB domain-containing protein n=1 Tax=Tagetes erecta TaxID=13708 RepID=A0AAD8P9J3_TARER|nr:hypothetical protein QVD17_03180 [Tagetes erecta]